MCVCVHLYVCKQTSLFRLDSLEMITSGMGEISLDEIGEAFCEEVLVTSVSEALGAVCVTGRGWEGVSL